MENNGKHLNTQREKEKRKTTMNNNNNNNNNDEKKKKKTQRHSTRLYATTNMSYTKTTLDLKKNNFICSKLRIEICTKITF